MAAYMRIPPVVHLDYNIKASSTEMLKTSRAYTQIIGSNCLLITH